MAIRIREFLFNQFGGLKTKIEEVLINETALSGFSLLVESDNVGCYHAYLQQIFISVGAVVFTGSGLNDATSGGTYVGNEDALYKVIITTAGATDKFKWQKDGGALSAEIDMSGSPQTLSDGV